jgi:hypothetical protein
MNFTSLSKADRFPIIIIIIIIIIRRRRRTLRDGRRMELGANLTNNLGFAVAFVCLPHHKIHNHTHNNV